jgi:general stress protein 26
MSKKPTPKPVDPSELPRLAQAVIKADRFPSLATIDGHQPRVRPVSPVRTDGFTVYVANLRSYHKTGEIEANPRVELAYLSPDHDQVRISGRAEVVTDAALLEEIWDATPLLRHYLGSLDNPELLVYRIVPEQVRFMREWSLKYHDVAIDRHENHGSSRAAPTLQGGAISGASRGEGPQTAASEGVSRGHSRSTFSSSCRPVVPSGTGSSVRASNSPGAVPSTSSSLSVNSSST